MRVCVCVEFVRSGFTHHIHSSLSLSRLSLSLARSFALSPSSFSYFDIRKHTLFVCLCVCVCVCVCVCFHLSSPSLRAFYQTPITTTPLHSLALTHSLTHSPTHPLPSLPLLTQPPDKRPADQVFAILALLDKALHSDDPVRMKMAEHGISTCWGPSAVSETCEYFTTSRLLSLLMPRLLS